MIVISLVSGYFISNIKRVDLRLVKTSNLVLSADNYVNSLTDTDSTLNNVISNGHTFTTMLMTVQMPGLIIKTVKLNGGGQLMPQSNWLFYVNIIYSMIMA